MAVLITGGAGYIGSHTAVELLNSGQQVVIIDDFSNSKPKVLERIKKITGKDFAFYELDIADKNKLNEVFAKEKIDSVIHFAGFKAVGESVEQPLKYYKNNVFNTITLCECMKQNNVFKLVFSSSATVYGTPKENPIKEHFPLKTANPYGTTKQMAEMILSDVCVSDKNFKVSILRYFNPIGANKSGLIGEDPNGIPNNLLPYVAQVGIGKLDFVRVFGNDYNTPDGTGVRDYIHVVDLSIAHIKALQHLENQQGIDYFNIGTGKGYSVLDVIKSYEKALGKPIPYKTLPRRAGDIDCYYGDPQKAFQVLGFKAQYDLDEMCKDTARWQLNNPNGYDE